jgi:hypothetical protein
MVSIPRISILRSMVWVAVVGGNFAVWRAVGSLETAVFVAPILVALQVGCYRAFRSQGDRRWFWLGFVAIGGVCPATVLWLSLFGRTVHQVAWPFVWVERFLEFSINGLLQWQRPMLRSYESNIFVTGTSFAITAFLPLCLIAVGGGCASYLIVRPCWRYFRRNRTAAGPRAVSKITSQYGSRSTVAVFGDRVD